MLRKIFFQLPDSGQKHFFVDFIGVVSYINSLQGFFCDCRHFSDFSMQRPQTGWEPHLQPEPVNPFKFLYLFVYKQ